MRLRVATVVAVVCLASCAAPGSLPESSAAESESPADRLEADLGGPDALLDFFETSSEDTIRDVLAEYGMGYEVHEVPAVEDKNIADCPQYFPSSDRNKWHAFDGEYYYVDGSGRPSSAYKYMPPISSAPRNSSCQASIGQWGDAENPSNDYDGGHLIGSQLGGWGKRANIVPQDLNFNRGNWAQLENKMAQCGGLSSGRLMYKASAGYPNGSALVPSTMSLFMKDMVQGDSISLSFQNVDYGGSNGTSQRIAGVNWLSAQGCN